MLSHQHRASSLVSPNEASFDRGPWSQRLAPYRSIRHLIARARGLQSFISVSAVIILGSGAVFSLICTVSAIRLGVPYPLALMAGYCTVVGSACLFTALLVVRSLVARVGTAPAAARQPNYAAWRLVGSLSVSDASRLWCDIEPGCAASQESIAWGYAMLDAIRRGELPVVEKHAGHPAAGREPGNPTWHTEVSRESLKSWAKAHGHSPQFLRD